MLKIEICLASAMTSFFVPTSVGITVPLADLLKELKLMRFMSEVECFEWAISGEKES